jgi:hypothetical protein
MFTASCTSHIEGVRRIADKGLYSSNDVANMLSTSTERTSYSITARQSFHQQQQWRCSMRDIVMFLARILQRVESYTVRVT